MYLGVRPHQLVQHARAVERAEWLARDEDSADVVRGGSEARHVGRSRVRGLARGALVVPGKGNGLDLARNVQLVEHRLDLGTDCQFGDNAQDGDLTDHVSRHEQAQDGPFLPTQVRKSGTDRGAVTLSAMVNTDQSEPFSPVNRRQAVHRLADDREELL